MMSEVGETNTKNQINRSSLKHRYECQTVITETKKYYLSNLT